MKNHDISLAWKYHNSTKHSWNSVRTNPHFLDWHNQPRLFKIYPGLEPVPLPQEPPQTGLAALSVIACSSGTDRREAPVRLADLASLCHFAAGITRRRIYPGGEILFRAAACTGALYSIELYAVCAELEDLGAGIYHFSPADRSLRRIRSGDCRAILVRATAEEPAVTQAPATIACTGTYWRNAWKYQARTYRHFGWDNGTILANLLAVAAAREIPAKVVSGFADDEVNRLLDLDSSREVALSLVPLGRTVAPAPTCEVNPLNLETAPYSHHEVDYPLMRQMHGASSLSMEEVPAWRSAKPPIPPPVPSRSLIPLHPLYDDEIPADSIEQVILRRGSSRRFSRSAITFQQLSTILHRATRRVPADFLGPSETRLNDVYLVCHAVQGLEPGAYFLHPDLSALELLKAGDFRKKTGYLGLEQDLPADCSAAVFFLADLKPILERLGNRGYRAAQLEAGIIGGRLYLAAYALRLGATGLTFYDDDVTEFFSPHAQGKSAIFLVAIGKSDHGQGIR